MQAPLPAVGIFFLFVINSSRDQIGVQALLFLVPPVLCPYETRHLVLGGGSWGHQAGP